MMILHFCLIIIIVINSYFINKKDTVAGKPFHIMMLTNIFTVAFLLNSVPGVGIFTYGYALLDDIFKEKKSIIKLFVSIHFILFFSLLYLTLLSKPDVNASIIMIVMSISLLAYIGLSGMLYSIRTLEIEKEEVKQLNNKLKLANIKLQEYAIEVEEITISKERTRVAQELHDSLGHSLMALTMHLEYAKKICTIKPEKVEEVLAQSEKIAKASIIDLRKAVTLLNSELEILDLNTSIEKLIKNFYLVSNLKINYNKNESVDELSTNIKTSIYKTIQESITNSLKHGNATEINIKISLPNDNVEVIITDNGIGCDNIIKSNGLIGIENRIEFLGGTTYYFSHNDLGFGIKLLIPIDTERR